MCLIPVSTVNRTFILTPTRSGSNESLEHTNIVHIATHCKKKKNVKFTVKYWQLWLPEIHRKKYGCQKAYRNVLYIVTVFFTVNFWQPQLPVFHRKKYGCQKAYRNVLYIVTVCFTVICFKNNIHNINLFTVICFKNNGYNINLFTVICFKNNII